MDSLVQFRLELERQLKIHEWKPTNTQIQLIASAVKRKSAGAKLSTADILGIVEKYSEVKSFFIMDGVDHSDLTALLLLATKAG